MKHGDHAGRQQLVALVETALPLQRLRSVRPRVRGASPGLLAQPCSRASPGHTAAPSPLLRHLPPRSGTCCSARRKAPSGGRIGLPVHSDAGPAPAPAESARRAALASRRVGRAATPSPLGRFWGLGLQLSTLPHFLLSAVLQAVLKPRHQLHKLPKQQVPMITGTKGQRPPVTVCRQSPNNLPGSGQKGPDDNHPQLRRGPPRAPLRDGKNP